MILLSAMLFCVLCVHALDDALYAGRCVRQGPPGQLPMPPGPMHGMAPPPIGSLPPPALSPPPAAGLPPPPMLAPPAGVPPAMAGERMITARLTGAVV